MKHTSWGGRKGVQDVFSTFKAEKQSVGRKRKKANFPKGDEVLEKERRNEILTKHGTEVSVVYLYEFAFYTSPNDLTGYQEYLS